MISQTYLDIDSNENRQIGVETPSATLSQKTAWGVCSVPWPIRAGIIMVYIAYTGQASKTWALQGQLLGWCTQYCMFSMSSQKTVRVEPRHAWKRRGLLLVNCLLAKLPQVGAKRFSTLKFSEISLILNFQQINFGYTISYKRIIAHLLVWLTWNNKSKKSIKINQSK